MPPCNRYRCGRVWRSNIEKKARRGARTTELRRPQTGQLVHQPPPSGSGTHKSPSKTAPSDLDNLWIMDLFLGAPLVRIVPPLLYRGATADLSQRR